MKKLTYTDLIAQLGISGAHPGGIALTKILLERENLNSSTKVLDLGCGTGQTSSFIKTNYDSDVAAIDIHPEMIEKAHNRFYSEKQKINLVQSNAENLPFEHNTFDFIIAE